MTPEERLSHLLDEDRWNGPGFVGRSVEPRQPRTVARFAGIVAAGLAVGVLVTLALSPLRSTTLPGVATSTPSGAPTQSASAQGDRAFTQSSGVSSDLGQQVQKAAVASQAPIVYWSSDRTSFTVVLWSDGCPETPLQLRVASPEELVLVFGQAIPGTACDGASVAESTTFTIPAGLDTSGKVTSQVTSAVMGTHTVVVADVASLVDVNPCSTAQLAGRVTGSGGAGGSLYQDLVLTNTSAQDCSLEGFPTISFRSSSGDVIGAVATYSPWKTTARVVLEARDGTAAVRLELGEAANFEPGDCAARTAAGIRVTVPGATGTLFASWPAQVCTVKGAHQFSASDVLAKRSTGNAGWQP